MIDIQQLTSLISAFRVETEKESISPETVGSILQAIADLLATATSETEYNIIRFWKETLQQFRFLYDIQQRNIDDHSNVIPSLQVKAYCLLVLDGHEGHAQVRQGLEVQGLRLIVSSAGRWVRSEIIFLYLFILQFG